MIENKYKIKAVIDLDFSVEVSAVDEDVAQDIVLNALQNMEINPFLMDSKIKFYEVNRTETITEVEESDEE